MNQGSGVIFICREIIDGRQDPRGAQTLGSHTCYGSLKMVAGMTREVGVKDHSEAEARDEMW